ncbi:uncharacterized protein LOC110458750, partial [Mizuhopecten yessoensis]|uniref:uncharacterized protein LOC110458750 n=1 Tax=Mizuhopecten yessoensis TaxID=6573 RepID=UPI000B458844
RLERGEQQQQYTAGIADNVEHPCNITITVVGQHGVGKSCFVRQLKQEYIPEGGPGPTDTADIYVNYMGYNPDTGFQQKLDIDGEIVTSRQRLKRIIDRYREDKKTSVQPSSSDSQTTPLPTNGAAASSAASSAANSTGVIQKLKRLFLKIFSRKKATEEVQQVDLCSEQRSVIGEVMRTDLDDRVDETKGYVTIYDFGGEKVFYNTHHCFMSSNMVFVLVFNVAMCLDPSTAKDGYESIESWLRSIATYAVDKAVQGTGTPPIILVGSHLDSVSENNEEQQKLFDSVLEKLWEKPEIRDIMKKHVQEEFPVAKLNDSTTNQDTYKRVWKKIIEIAPLQSQWMEVVPARWVALEHELVRLKNTEKCILTYAELLEINSKLAVPLAEDDVMKFLLNLKFSASFLCFDLHSKTPFIVLQAQWIIDAFKAIITDPKFATKTLPANQRLQWSDYERSGILPDDFIKQLWGRYEKYRFLEQGDKLCIVMETLGLLSRPLSVGNEVEYFIVPSILQAADPEIIRPVLDDPDTVKTVALCLKFDNPFIQQALWDKLIAACIHRFERLKGSGLDGSKIIQRGFACLQVDFLWNMIINCKDNAMKVVMFRKSRDRKQPLAGTGINLRKVFEILLNRILEMNYQSHLKYQFYLHNDYQFAPYETMVKEEHLQQTTESLQCGGKNGPGWIDRDDLYIWFEMKRTDDRRFDKTTKQLSPKEMGRISRYVGEAYYTFFIELDCPVEIMEQEMKEHHHLAFRSRITKIFLHLLKIKKDVSFATIADAMSKHGMDPTKLSNIIDSQSNVKNSYGDTLPTKWLQQCLSVNDAKSIAEWVDIKAYFNMFLELGFPPAKVDDFDDQYRNEKTRVKVTAMLEAFICEIKPCPTVNKILLAMQECDMDTEPVINAFKQRLKKYSLTKE